MTNKKLIAELRSHVESAADCGFIHNVSIDGRLLASLLDQLESLQHQLDYRNEVLIRAIVAREAAEAELSRLKTETTERELRLEGVITKQEAELAKLKGDAVPFAFSYNYAGCETCEGFRDWRKELSKERPPEWMLETGKVTDLVELFTHAQPVPVVVLPHIQREFVNQLTRAAATYGETQQLRAQVAKVVQGFIDGITVKSADGEGE